ncbi:MAG: T9SS type A sorting domain-containing protein [Bacteroidales bacterium]|nr:T9SS type A sorting domain-containing protein [Bacteroidales bacterium]
MKKYILLFAFFIFLPFSYSQIVVTQNDMPDIKDIFVLNLEFNLGQTFSYEDAGANFIWDISDLTFSSQRRDTFVSVLSTPLIFNLYFNNGYDTARRATIATPRNLEYMPPGITIEDVFFFMKESSEKYSEVGFGAYINDTPIPIKYDNPDVLYRFPITFGTKDTTYSNFSIDIPAYGYYGQQKKRINTVDGWGALILNQSHIPVMRIKSELFIEDTIFVTQYNQGYKLVREEIEYKWIGNGIGVPLLLVAERMNSVSMEAFDSMYVNTAGIENLIESDGILIYPNPANEYINLSFILEKKSEISYSLYDLNGRLVLNLNRGLLNKGMVIDRIDLINTNLNKGIYFLEISIGNQCLRRKIQIY